MTIIEALQQAVSAAGSRNAFCKAHGLSPSYVSDVLGGRRAAGPKILAVIGWERQVTVQPKAEVNDGE